MRQLRSAGIGSRPPILHLRNLASREARVRDRARAHSIPGRVVRQAIIHAPQGRRMWIYNLRVRLWQGIRIFPIDTPAVV